MILLECLPETACRFIIDGIDNIDRRNRSIFGPISELQFLPQPQNLCRLSARRFNGSAGWLARNTNDDLDDFPNFHIVIRLLISSTILDATFLSGLVIECPDGCEGLRGSSAVEINVEISDRLLSD